jgi:hypothetical protein
MAAAEAAMTAVMKTILKIITGAVAPRSRCSVSSEKGRR